MEFKKEIIINKQIEAVWEILGNQFGDVYKWASGLNHSKAFSPPVINGAPSNNRSCELPSGKIKEVIRKFDPSNYVLEYEVIEGFPFFVDTAINNWQLTKISSEGTKVNMHLIVKTKGLIGSVMNPMMKMQLKKQLIHIPNDLKYYVETGNPSQNKAKELEQLSTKVA
ncbi:SRPBCC family protein [Aquimarina sp. BL5]|uniref:SRPBCC family protein n=1 Tax=Aquimarina sp. BL5 TaxID=1714860 RepID=UPI000E54E7E8|nr:SRPBCC family protein [Aquimarina sp. BL5]AXT49929.1 SRPBCC family protein [Aquimarina sp. BL5]RKN01082.1 SRPBCC family protein [Aquimarina sp. BL5]